MMQTRLKIHISLLLISGMIFLSSIIIQAFWHLEPCPLCIMQRLTFMAFAFIAFIALLLHHHHKIMRYFHIVMMLLCCLGGYFALRQLYLQHTSMNEIISCMPSFAILNETLPKTALFKLLFWGSADCAKVTWSFMNLSLASWSFIAFVLLFMLILLAISQNRKEIIKMKQHNPNFVRISEEARQHIKECDIETVKRKLEQNEKFYLIDVREASEWNMGHLPSAIHLSKGMIECDIERVVPNQQETIILYCGGGFRSALAAENLQRMGYQNVISMQGGFRAWSQAGYTVESN